jgi:hypothetical protein
VPDAADPLVLEAGAADAARQLAPERVVWTFPLAALTVGFDGLKKARPLRAALCYAAELSAEFILGSERRHAAPSSSVTMEAFPTLRTISRPALASS